MTCACHETVRKARIIAAGLVPAVVALLLTRTAFPQASHGLISGTVEDPQSAPVPEARVTAQNVLTTARLITRSNESGYFVFPEVLPGTYTLIVEKEGFQKLERTGVIVLPADRRSVGTLQLPLGSVQSVVTVAGETIPVETTSSQQSAVITAAEMASLPSLGRDYMALTRTLPGSNYVGEGNASLGTVSSQAKFQGLAYNTAVNVNTNGVFSSISNYSWDDAPSVMDNIQDVKVLTANYEPQYGKVEGAVINVTTKSGTTKFHGGAYYYLRNEDLNANDFFNNRNGLPRSRYRYNTLGGTLGGPVYLPGRFSNLRNKLFFFLSLDDEPSTVPEGPRYYLVPTQQERQGDFSQSYLPGTNQAVAIYDPLTKQPFTGNAIPSSQVNSLMQKVLNIFPLPNFTNRQISNGAYNYVIGDSNSNPTNLESLRIDYALADKWNIFGRWQRSFYGSNGRNEPGISAGWMNGTQSYNNTHERFEFNVTYTISPSMVNQFAIGHFMNYEKNEAPQSTIDQFVATKQGIQFPQPYPQNNPLNLFPAMSFTNGPSFSYDPRFPMDNYTAGYSVSDGFNYIYKDHQLKFGVYADLEMQHQPNHAGGGSFAGSFSFSNPNPNNPFNAGYSYAEALLGYFDSYSVSTARVLDANTARTFEWYAQDNWRVTKKLTLNYGARFTFDIPQAIAGNNGAELNFGLYKASAAAPLYQPVLVNGVRMTQNPVTGELAPPIYLDKFVPGAGSPAPGSVTVGSPDWNGLFTGKGVQVAPRFGFAYDVFGDGKTAIRGGVGAFFAQRTFSGQIYGDIVNPPTVFYPTQYYGNINTFASATGLLSPSSEQYLDPKSGLPYTLQWSLGIQREIGVKSVLGVAYVANASRKTPYSYNLNEVPYGAQFRPQNQDPTTNTPLPDDYFRPYPGYASINYNNWGDNGNYNSLQVTLNRRFQHNLTLGAAYTWAKSLDDNRSTTYLPGSLTYGPNSLDMRHRLTADWVWNVPNVSRLWKNWLSRSVFDNWEISGIASFISGTPLNVSLGTTNNLNITGGGDGARVIATGSPVLPKGQRTFNQYFNTSVFALPAVGTIGNQWTSFMHGPGVNDWDIAFSKNIRVKDKAAAQLRFEGYNLFNHTQFSGVNTSAQFNPSTGQQVNLSFGQLNADRGPRIIQVSARVTF